MIEKLRNKARPYLFSNNILPMVAATGIEILDMISKSKTLIKKLADNTIYFREKMVDAGFNVRDKNAVHPVVPVMLGDAILASKFAKNVSLIMLLKNYFRFGTELLFRLKFLTSN